MIDPSLEPGADEERDGLGRTHEARVVERHARRGGGAEAEELRLLGHVPFPVARADPIRHLHVAACVVTIGEALEQRVAALWASRELPLASMLDSVGSGAVESLAEYVNDVLCAQGLTAGLAVTNRISPGYADWDVTEQHALFRLCPGDAVGVVLNAACFMRPGKSISLLVGAGVRARVDHYFSQCARCWMRDCTYRRTPARGRVHR